MAESCLDDDNDAAGADVVVEEKELVRFEKAAEFIDLLTKLIPSHSGPSKTSADSQDTTKTSNEALKKLSNILDEYQEHSYLLDPYLDQIVVPPIVALQSHIRGTCRLSDSSIFQLSKLIYLYTKVRGYKTIISFFPHGVADLSPTLHFLEQLTKTNSQDAAPLSHCWELRYVLLLWLSLICMIPFNLNKFDIVKTNQDDATSTSFETTASRIEQMARVFIVSPGKERDAAAVMLGKLFQRQDVYHGQFESFTAFCSATLVTAPSPFAATGVLQALCEIVKTSDSHFVKSRLSAVQAVLDLYDDPQRQNLTKNGLVTKYQTKLACRLGLKFLRPREPSRFIRIKTLGGGDDNAHSAQPSLSADDEDEQDVPEVMDGYISRLIDALQNKDTVVRYSAAKGIARLCERLPRSFISQVCDAVVSLFHINIPDLYDGRTDLSSVSEHTWQGACMALAELARRGLLFAQELQEKLEWIEKALLFDVQRGSHSVGSNVRDSACYVVWALARSHDPDALRPYALHLAQKLVAVTTLDRDVSIRRAASAAFQECVGRLDLFPHGIDVIRMTDFYAVSVRRNAFLECAAQVASFSEYRSYMLEHLLSVTIVHWDAAMRQLGAKTLALITALDLDTLAPGIVDRLAKLASSPDTNALHGSLLSLANICIQCSLRDTENSRKIQDKAFGLLSQVPGPAFRAFGAGLVLQAACLLVRHGISERTAVAEPAWQDVLNIALARHEEYVHQAAADAILCASRVTDCTARIASTLQDWQILTVAQQQSHALSLGMFDFARHPASMDSVLRHLMATVDSLNVKSPHSRYSANVETRRNASISLSKAVIHLGADLPTMLSASLCQEVIHHLLMGLDDYTTDQRGDVGSWVRLACMEGLFLVVDYYRMLYRQNARFASQISDWLPSPLYIRIVAGFWKQTAERIDQVRQVAGNYLVQFYKASIQADDVEIQTRFPRPLGLDIVQAHLLDTNLNFKDPNWIFPRLAEALRIQPYRSALLEGIVLSVGSKTDLGQRVISPALFDFLLTQLDCSDGIDLGESLVTHSYPPIAMLEDLTILAKTHFSNNRMFIPTIQTVSLLLENGLADILEYDDRLKPILSKLIQLGSSHILKVKSIQRVNTCMALLTNLLSFEDIRSDLVPHLVVFLSHPFPTSRGAASEKLFLVLQTLSLQVPEQAKQILLDTRWSFQRKDHFTTEAKKVISLIQQSIGG